VSASSPRLDPETHEGGTVRAQASVTAISNRDPSIITERGGSHKRPREAFAENWVDLSKKGPKRRRLEDTTLRGASSSFDHVETKGRGVKEEVEMLVPTREGGNTRSEHGRKLNGFQVDFDNILCDDQKGWCFSWVDLQQILLRAGQKRNKEQRELENAT